MKLYVEGGGDAAALKTACREGFAKFLGKAGLSGRMPRIVACGSREDAYDSFCTAVRCGEPAMLLVDSESAVLSAAQAAPAPEKWQPWLHLQHSDGWQAPKGSQDLQCHLMVQCMEAWLLADRATLKQFFGVGFKETALPPASNPLEKTAKKQVMDALATASRDCKTKSQYGKGEHSFKLLALTDPVKVMDASPWARRLIEALQARMSSR